MLQINSVMLGTSDRKKLSDFYEKVFGKGPTMNDDNVTGWAFDNFFFGIMNHSEITGESKEPARFFLNIETKEVKEEFERIKNLGAKVIQEAYEVAPNIWMATFADIDGNYFQLMSPWAE